MNKNHSIPATLPKYSETKLPCYVFDIDGTIADNSHRLHHIKAYKKDWHLYNSEVEKDTPITSVINVLSALSFNNTIILLTGRSESTRAATERWLKTHGIEPDCLLMRDDEDFRKDYEMKSDHIDEIQSSFEILGAFDDNKDVLTMLRLRGIHTLDCSQIH